MRCLGGSGLTAAAITLASLATVASAGAKVHREGAWPDADKPVTLDADGIPRRDALRKLADAAGWSLVVHASPGDVVDVHVKAQPASKVLELLLEDGDYVARRDGTLVSIDHVAAPPTASVASAASVAPAASAAPAGSVAPSGVAGTPPAPPIPAVPPIAAIGSVGATPGVSALSKRPLPPSAEWSFKLGDKGSEMVEPHRRGEDRTIVGGDVTIAPGETARDITVFAGNVQIRGDVTGDITIFGGTAHVYEGARVQGDAAIFAGVLQLDNGSRVDGDVSSAGGSLIRDPGSVIDGDVTIKGGREIGPGDSDSEARASRPGFLRRSVDSFLDGVRLAAVLFVVGTVLLALAGRRMDTLRGEVAARPMRSIAVGLLGVLGGALVIAALSVTIIGIPVAIVAAMVATFSVLASMCAVLSVVGEGLLRHKTENPYLHLALGCGLFVALSAIPWVGGIVIAAVVLAGVGVLVATRGAGFLRRKNGGPSSGPYRTAPTGS